MATSSTSLCYLCLEENLSVSAVIWCLDCHEFLCKDCDHHHGKSKLSKHHKTIQHDDLQNISEAMLTIKNTCSEHDEKFEFFCTFHDCPCCIRCIKEHKDCSEVGPIKDVLDKVKSSAAFIHLERDLENTNRNLDKLCNHLMEYKKRVHEQKGRDMKELERLHKSISKHIDSIQKILLNDMSIAEENIVSEVNSLTCKIEDKRKAVASLRTDLFHLQDKASDLQSLLGIRKVESKIVEMNKFAEDIKKECSNEKHLELQFLPSIVAFETSLTSFGKICVTTTASNIQLDAGKDQAQLFVPKKDIEGLTLTKKLTIKLSKDFTSLSITDCAILPGERFVFVDEESKKLLLYDCEGILKDTFSVFKDFTPFSVCHFSDNTVIVSVTSDNKLQYFDFSTKSVLNTVTLNGKCSGVDCNGKNIIVRVLTHNVILFRDLKGKAISRVNTPSTCTTHVAISNDKIYCTDNRGMVLCYKVSGEHLLTYEHESLRDPIGITVDSSERVYVTCLQNNSVVVISSGFGSSKVLLTSAEGLKSPLAVDVDQKKSLLVVCNHTDGQAFVYNVQQK